MGKSSGRGMGFGGGGYGPGLFFGIGTRINCDSKDDSYYCSFMKFMNAFLMILLFIAILYFIWTFASPYLKSGKGRITGR